MRRSVMMLLKYMKVNIMKKDIGSLDIFTDSVGSNEPLSRM